MSTQTRERTVRFLSKNRYMLLLLLAGLLLLRGPGERGGDSADHATEAEQRLRYTLEQMEGVGEVRVLLAETGGRSGGFTGAIVVCRGAGSATVRLRVVEAVSAFTGLGSDRIMVLKMKNAGRQQQ